MLNIKAIQHSNVYLNEHVNAHDGRNSEFQIYKGWVRNGRCEGERVSRKNVDEEWAVGVLAEGRKSASTKIWLAYIQTHTYIVLHTLILYYFVRICYLYEITNRRVPFQAKP